MHPSEVDQILQVISSYRNITETAEITVETNPQTVTVQSLKQLRQTGVNRLSIGIQSFRPNLLTLLNRTHTAEGGMSAVESARSAGFENISLDLMYGLPTQTLEDIAESVVRAVGLGIDHLSTYALTIEPGTPFERKIKNRQLSSPDPDITADHYAVICEIMNQQGFTHYELTNFARGDKFSQHNLVYWRRTPYLGIGCSSHSFNGLDRFWNTRSTSDYIKQIQAGQMVVEGTETLTDENVLSETVYLSLRTFDGVSRQYAEQKCSITAIKELNADGFLEERSGRWHIPEHHWLLLDEIALKILQV